MRKKSLALGSAATLVGGSAGALLLAMVAGPAGAAPMQYNVDTLDDGNENAQDCITPVANSCSLRDALGAVTDGDTIAFVAGLSGTIALTNGELEIADDIRLTGPGADVVTVDAGGNSRVFYICAGPNTSIEGLTITGGVADAGAGLYDECGNGTTLRYVVVTGNQATDAGGGLYSNGDITIIDSVFSDNGAVLGGGGMYIDGNLTMSGTIVTGNTIGDAHGGGGAFVSGDVAIYESTFDSNAAGCGGGLHSSVSSGSILITGSTFSNNTASVCYGGGINIDGNDNEVLIANSTITGNSAVAGGGLHVDYDNLTFVAQSTIVGNTATSPDPLYSGGGIHFGDGQAESALVGTIVSGNTAAAGPADIGFGGSGTTTSGSVSAFYSLLGSVDPRLAVLGDGYVLSNTPGVGVLADNGGPTMTMALLATSPALDAGPETVFPFPGDEFDQRGTGFPRIVGNKPDIGAFESQGFAPDPTTTSTTTAGEPVVPTFAG